MCTHSWIFYLSTDWSWLTHLCYITCSFVSWRRRFFYDKIISWLDHLLPSYDIFDENTLCYTLTTDLLSLNGHKTWTCMKLFVCYMQMTDFSRIAYVYHVILCMYHTTQRILQLHRKFFKFCCRKKFTALLIPLPATVWAVIISHW